MHFLSRLAFCLCTFSLSVLTLHGQVPAQAPSNESILGAWEWHSGSDSFRVVLQREPNFHLPDGTTQIAILGRHSYKKSGILIEQSLTMAGQDGNPGFTLLGVPSTDNPFSMSFFNITTGRRGEATMEVLSGTNQLRWHFKPKETITINKPLPASFSVPTDLILTRVN
jgi:hypothetical protein